MNTVMLQALTRGGSSMTSYTRIPVLYALLCGLAILAVLRTERLVNRIIYRPLRLAMRLTGSAAPLIHTTMAQSMGLYREDIKDFDREALGILGIDEKYLPEVSDALRPAGLYCGKVPVYCALGDNQASVYGACAGVSEALLNIGTGSQISLICDAYVKVPGLDTRPYVDGKYILSGSSLCGGSAYDVLKSLVQDVLQRYD